MDRQTSPRGTAVLKTVPADAIRGTLMRTTNTPGDVRSYTLTIDQCVAGEKQLKKGITPR